MEGIRSTCRGQNARDMPANLQGFESWKGRGGVLGVDGYFERGRMLLGSHTFFFGNGNCLPNFALIGLKLFKAKQSRGRAEIDPANLILEEIVYIIILRPRSFRSI